MFAKPKQHIGPAAKIQRHKVFINKNEPIEGINTLNEEQAQVFKALKVTKVRMKNEQKNQPGMTEL